MLFFLTANWNAVVNSTSTLEAPVYAEYAPGMSNDAVYGSQASATMDPTAGEKDGATAAYYSSFRDLPPTTVEKDDATAAYYSSFRDLPPQGEQDGSSSSSSTAYYSSVLDPSTPCQGEAGTMTTTLSSSGGGGVGGGGGGGHDALYAQETAPATQPPLLPSAAPTVGASHISRTGRKQSVYAGFDESDL
jgi:hypothetical protein